MYRCPRTSSVRISRESARLNKRWWEDGCWICILCKRWWQGFFGQVLCRSHSSFSHFLAFTAPHFLVNDKKFCLFTPSQKVVRCKAGLKTGVACQWSRMRRGNAVRKPWVVPVGGTRLKSWWLRAAVDRTFLATVWYHVIARNRRVDLLVLKFLLSAHGYVAWSGKKASQTVYCLFTA